MSITTARDLVGPTGFKDVKELPVIAAIGGVTIPDDATVLYAQLLRPAEDTVHIVVTLGDTHVGTATFDLKLDTAVAVECEVCGSTTDVHTEEECFK